MWIKNDVEYIINMILKYYTGCQKLRPVNSRKRGMDMEDRDDVVLLVDEEGNEHQFAVVDVFPVNENQYAILIPLYADSENGEAESEEGEEAFIFRLVERDGEQALEEVDEEEEWQQVAQEWEIRLRQLEEQEDHDN